MTADRSLFGAVHVDYRGRRYVLGRTSEVYGLWDGAGGGPPMEVFPLSTDGWARAWQRYQVMEAAAEEAPAGRGAPYPLTVGQIVGGGFRLWTRHFWVLTAVAAILLVPSFAAVTVLTASTFELIRPPGTSAVQAAVPLWARVVNDLIVYGIAVPLVAGAVIHAAAAGLIGGRPTFGGSLRAMGRRIPTLLLVTLVAGVAMLIPLLPGVVALMVTPVDSSLLGLAVAVLLAGVVPAVFLALRFLLASSVAVVEGRRGIEPLRRSWMLVRGMTWRVLGAMLLAGLVVFAAVLLLVVILLVAVVGDAVMLTESVARQFLVWSGVGSAVALTAAVPFADVVIALLYVDARVRKEGLDLETVARETGVSPS